MWDCSKKIDYKSINFKIPWGTYHFFHVLNFLVLSHISKYLHLTGPAHDTVDMILFRGPETPVPVPALSLINYMTLDKSISLTSAIFQSSIGQSCNSWAFSSCYIFNIGTVLLDSKIHWWSTGLIMPNPEIHIFM